MKKVLIVDDSSAVLSLIKLEINLHSIIEPYYAQSYADAEKLIHEHQGQFHAALLDLNLPDAQNGEIVKLANVHNIPAVILSATVNEELKDKVMKQGAVDFILKNDLACTKFAVTSIIRVLKNYDTTILIVDDSKFYRESLKKSLYKIHLNILEATDGLEALEMVEKNRNISLVLTDQEMPNMTGTELTYRLRLKYKKDELAIIAMSSLSKEDILSTFLRFGANDFINKPFTDSEVITRINSNLELIDLFTTLKDLANKDFLTGMFNRRYFFDSASSILQKNKRKAAPVAVATIDIDKFKNLNDTYGHDIGDIAIKEVKNILCANLRASDLVARFGGEEFCILLEGINLTDLTAVFEKIRAAFEANVFKADKNEISYTVSIGIGFGLGNSIEEMIKISDNALYEAKSTGRNKVVIKEV